MDLKKLWSLPNRLGARLGEIIASILFPVEVVIPPQLIKEKMGVTPLEQGDLVINNFYLHVVITPDTYNISIHEFSPVGRPQVSRHPYMPGLEGFAA
jgi:hypothetical protein